MYHIRVDTSGDNPFVLWLTENCKSILVSEETTQNQNNHIHIIVDTDTPVQTIRNRLRGLGFKGNRSYSISQCRDEVKAIAYALKDSKIIVNTIPSELYEKASKYDLQVKEEMNKTKKNNIRQGIEDYAASKKLTLSNISLHSWSRLAVEYYKKEGIMFREFQVVSNVDTLYLKHNENAISEMTERIHSRVSRKN